MSNKRYDNERVLFSARMSSTLSCPPATKKLVDEIFRLLDAINECIRAFKNMGKPVDQWDDWYAHLLVHKLNPVTREDYETSLKDSKALPTYEELTKFLDTRVRSLEATSSNDICTESNPSKNSKADS